MNVKVAMIYMKTTNKKILHNISWTLVYEKADPISPIFLYW